MSQFQTQFTNPVAPQAAQSATNAGQFAQANQDRAQRERQMAQQGQIANRELDQRAQGMRQEGEQFRQGMEFQGREGQLNRDNQLQQQRMQNESWDAQRAHDAQMQRERMQVEREMNDRQWQMQLSLEKLKAQAAVATGHQRAQVLAEANRQAAQLKDFETRKNAANLKLMGLNKQNLQKAYDMRRKVDDAHLQAKDGELLGEKVGKEAALLIAQGLQSADFKTGTALQTDEFDQLDLEGRLQEEWGVDLTSFYNPLGMDLLGRSDFTRAREALPASKQAFDADILRVTVDSMSKAMLNSGMKTGADSKVKEALAGLVGAAMGAGATTGAGGEPKLPDLGKHIEALEAAGVPGTVIYSMLNVLDSSMMAYDVDMDTQILKLQQDGGGYVPGSLENLGKVRMREAAKRLRPLAMTLMGGLEGRVMRSESLAAFKRSLEQALGDKQITENDELEFGAFGKQALEAAFGDQLGELRRGGRQFMDEEAALARMIGEGNFMQADFPGRQAEALQRAELGGNMEMVRLLEEMLSAPR